MSGRSEYPDADTTGASNSGLKKEVEEELLKSERMLKELKEPSPGAAWAGAAAAILLLIDISVLLLVPQSFLIWVVATFLLYSYSYVVLFLPTQKRGARTRREHSRNGKMDVKGTAKTIYRTRKKLLSQVLLAMLFMNMEPLVFGLGMIFIITASFAAIDGLTGLISPLLSVAIVFFSVIAVCFYIWVARAKPYSERFLSLFMGMRGAAKESFGKGWSSGLKFSLWLAVAIGAIGMGFVAGMILPGMFLSRVEELLEPDFGTNMVTIIFMLTTEYTVVRYFQSRRSRIMAISVMQGRIDVMRREVLVRFEEPSISSDETRIREVRSIYNREMLFKVDRHDFNGWFPVYLVTPQLRLLLDREVLDSVDAIAVGADP